MSEDTVSLYDLWNVLVRRRWLVIAVLLASLAVGVGYALLRPLSYDFYSGIDIGYVYRGEAVDAERYRSIESADAAQARLNDLIVPGVRRELAADAEAVPRVSVSVRAADNSLLLASAATPAHSDTVAKLHAAIARALADAHQPYLERELGLVLGQLESRAAALQQDIALEREELVSLQQRDYRAGAELLALSDAQRIADLRRSLTEKQGELAQLQATMQGVRQASRGTRASFLASQSEQAKGGSSGLIVLLSLVAGIMTGFMSAFFTEFAANARRYRQTIIAANASPIE